MLAKIDFAKASRSKVENAIASYFSRKGTKSITGLALHLGVTRRCLTDYSKTDKFGDLIEEAKLRCENILEERMIQGVPPTGMIFILKNNYGWSDKVDINQTVNGTISLASLFDRSQAVKALKEPEPIEAEVVEEAPDDLFEIPTTHNEKLPTELF